MTEMIKIDEVQRRVSLSRSQIYKLIKQGQFPSQVKLGRRRSAWNADDVEKWLQRQIQASK